LDRSDLPWRVSIVSCPFVLPVVLAGILSKYHALQTPSTRAMSAGNYSPRSSHDSDDSLRALELTEGPSGYPASRNRSKTHLSRSRSSSGFYFEPDLFQLTATLDDVKSGELGEKRIGFMKGVALCAGLQVRTLTIVFQYIRPSQHQNFRLDPVSCTRLDSLLTLVSLTRIAQFVSRYHS
jgi:hypothetical protein